MSEKLGEVKVPVRGYETIAFLDGLRSPCILQHSSVDVWLGEEDNVMNLDRKMVGALVAHLQAWLDTGSFGIDTVSKNVV